MQPKIRHENTQIYTDLTPLIAQKLEQTYLAANSAAADTTLTVKDIDGFGVSDYLILGELGSEACELVKVHASTAPSGTTITLITGGTEFAHSAGTKVYKVAFNQLEISHAATLTGSKSVLATQNIQVDGLEHVYTDVSQTTGFYFVRFKDETGSTFSSYSDGVPYGGWATNTVGYLMQSALKNNGVSLSERLTRDRLFEFTNDGLKLTAGKLKRFPQYLTANSILGQTTRGIYELDLPTDIYDNDTHKSIKAVRIGERAHPLQPVDPQIFEEIMGEAVVTQVRTEASANDTSLAVDNSYDFDDAGTLNVYVSGTKDSFTYTAVTRDDADGGSAAFTGIPSSGDDAIGQTTAVDINVWQNEEEGEPVYCTVRNGKLALWPIPDSSWDNKNVYLDYFTEATEVNSEGDTLDVQRYDIIKDYVTWRVRMDQKNDGMLDMNDGWFIQFKEKLNDYIRTTPMAFKNKMRPNINRVNYRRPGFGRVDLNNDGS